MPVGIVKPEQGVNKNGREGRKEMTKGETTRSELDEVLGYFNSPSEQGGFTFDNLVNHFDAEHTRNFGHQLISIIEKLIRDKLIFNVSPYNQQSKYHITAEGKMFDIIKCKQEKEAQEVRDSVQVELLKNQKLNLKWTRRAAKVGAGVLIYYILSFVFQNRSELMQWIGCGSA